jgi:iron complex transport system substrate-binding protein
MRRLLTLLVPLALVLAACGDDSSTATTGTAPPGAATAPQRIVSLSPTATETLFAIGAGKQVVAVDDQSNHPVDAPRTDLSGFKPNIEAIAAKNPDLVIVQYDADGIVGKLTTLKIPTLVQPSASNLAEAYAQIEELGRATGHAARADDVVGAMRARIDELVARVPGRSRPVRYYHEVDSTLYTATSKTFIGEIYKLAGLQNIADAADDGTGYPQLSAEYLVQQNPDVIFLADTKCCAQTARTFGQRPGFNRIAAVQNGVVIELDDDIASRWGPRTPLLLEAVLEALSKLPAPSAR